MHNDSLVSDYLTRAKHRLAAVEVLLKAKSYADVVRESQEVVELTLKALLRSVGIEGPWIYDAGDILLEQIARMPKELVPKIEQLATISRSLRRDRELAFYGSEDLTPSHFYKLNDAEKAYQDASWVYLVVSESVKF